MPAELWVLVLGGLAVGLLFLLTHIRDLRRKRAASPPLHSSVRPDPGFDRGKHIREGGMGGLNGGDGSH